MNLRSLVPSLETHEFFSELCEYVKKDDHEDIQITPEIREINKICSLAEYELEKYWNAKIVGATDPRKELQDFIYYDNYLQLTRLEITNAKHFFGDIEHRLFV